MNLKNQLKHLLEEKNLTAAALSRASGVSKSVISDWLAGSSPRDISQVKKVATVLGTTLDHLCFGDGEEEDVEKRSSGGDIFDSIINVNDGWVGGVFEIKIRRIKKRD